MSDTPKTPEELEREKANLEKEKVEIEVETEKKKRETADVELRKARLALESAERTALVPNLGNAKDFDTTLSGDAPIFGSQVALRSLDVVSRAFANDHAAIVSDKAVLLAESLEAFTGMRDLLVSFQRAIDLTQERADHAVKLAEKLRQTSEKTGGSAIHAETLVSEVGAFLTLLAPQVLTFLNVKNTVISKPLTVEMIWARTALAGALITKKAKVLFQGAGPTSFGTSNISNALVNLETTTRDRVLDALVSLATDPDSENRRQGVATLKQILEDVIKSIDALSATRTRVEKERAVYAETLEAEFLLSQAELVVVPTAISASSNSILSDRPLVAKDVLMVLGMLSLSVLIFDVSSGKLLCGQIYSAAESAHVALGRNGAEVKFRPE